MDPVIVVDDDVGMRTSLASLLESEGFEVEMHESAGRFIASFKQETRGCVVLDLNLPDMSGLEVLERLNASSHQVAVLVVTAYGDVPTAVRAMNLGAFDFIQKPFQPDDLIEKIRRGHELSATLVHKADERRQIEEKFNLLSCRERSVLELLVAGFSNKQIAFQLKLSEKTVSAHRSHILAKTGADSIVSLVHLMGLVGLDREGMKNLDPAQKPAPL
ncbi:MAG: response regulator transcription factor [Phycisphaeraceae bacterium]|nr:response regulator transcription factor [Phycisphaeraceae bacterium]